MKFFAVFVVIFLVMVNEILGVHKPELSGVENIRDHVRVKRLACDLLNPIQGLELNVGEALCTNLCKLQGKSGGHCTQEKNCQCNE